MYKTLPGRYYTDPSLHSREMERFFFHRWIHAGREERVAKPGDYFLCDVAGESVIVTRDANGSLRAFYNVCRHRGTRLCSQPEGSLGTRIRCPYHSWTYALDGSLMAAPLMDEAFSKADYPLHAVQIDTWEGHLFLNLGGMGTDSFFARATHEGHIQPASKKGCLSPLFPLTSQLGTLPEKFANWHMGELCLGKRMVYDIKANWKLIVANYNECLHCPTVHPALNKLTDYTGADNEPPTANYIGGSMGFREGIETMTFDGVRHREYLPGLDETQRKLVAYYAIFPNLLLALHPDYMLVHTLWPKAVDRTEIVCEWHFQPGETVIDDAIEFWDLTNRQDWFISEQSQAGISSRAYTPGPYSKREELLWGFDQIISAE